MAADDTLGAFINDLFAGADDEVPLQEFRRGLVHKRMKDIAVSYTHLTLPTKRSV